MKPKLLTDTELRAIWPLSREKTLRVPEGTLLTPSARDYLRENGIELSFEPIGGQFEKMPMTSIPTEHGEKRYVDAVTGEELTAKPENMTHLRENLLVSKTHPRIAFRGKLDSLMAQVLVVQVEAEKECPPVADALDEILHLLRSILRAEVKEEPLAEIRLLGMGSDALRSASHHIKEELGIPHPVPDYRMGKLCVLLNSLRTQVRETELCACAVFTDGQVCSREDIVEALNRLSSCVYLLFCRKLAGYYDRRRQT